MTANDSVTHHPKNTARVGMDLTIHYSRPRAGLSNAGACYNPLTVRLIGMVHVPPLPGSPRWEGSMERVVAAAVADARALVEGGMDALLVENHGDAPFTPARVEAATVASLAVVAHEVHRACPTVPLGINVLKNDARSAVAVACAVGARFIRVNVHAGAVLADQGIVQSDAHGTLRDRRLLGADVALFADVGGKHAVPLAPVDLEQHAHDLLERGLADGLVVSGPATGAPTPLDVVKRVRGVAPRARLLVGSGVTAETAAAMLSVADGLIVGSSLKRDGRVGNPVDPERVRRLVRAVGGR
jgi:membrane complex biogenesis BtpA family protein